MDRADSNGPDLQAGLAAEGEGALGKGFGFVGVLGFKSVGEVLLSWGGGGGGRVGHWGSALLEDFCLMFWVLSCGGLAAPFLPTLRRIGLFRLQVPEFPSRTQGTRF